MWSIARPQTLVLGCIQRLCRRPSSKCCEPRSRPTCARSMLRAPRCVAPAAGLSQTTPLSPQLSMAGRQPAGLPSGGRDGPDRRRTHDEARSSTPRGSTTATATGYSPAVARLRTSTGQPGHATPTLDLSSPAGRLSALRNAVSHAISTQRISRRWMSVENAPQLPGQLSLLDVIKTQEFSAELGMQVLAENGYPNSGKEAVIRSLFSPWEISMINWSYNVSDSTRRKKLTWLVLEESRDRPPANPNAAAEYLASLNIRHTRATSNVPGSGQTPSATASTPMSDVTTREPPTPRATLVPSTPSPRAEHEAWARESLASLRLMPANPRGLALTRLVSDLRPDELRAVRDAVAADVEGEQAFTIPMIRAAAAREADAVRAEHAHLLQQRRATADTVQPGMLAYMLSSGERIRSSTQRVVATPGSQHVSDVLSRFCSRRAWRDCLVYAKTLQSTAPCATIRP